MSDRLAHKQYKEHAIKGKFETSIVFMVMLCLFCSTLVSSCYKHEDRIFIANKSSKNIYIESLSINKDVVISKNVKMHPIKEKGMNFYEFYGVVDFNKGDDIYVSYRKELSDGANVFRCKIHEDDYCIYHIVIKDNENICTCDSMRETGSK